MMHLSSLTSRRALIATAVVSVVALSVSACSSSSGNKPAGSAPSSATASSSAALSQVVQAGFDGVVQKPPATGDTAVRGKTVWFLNCLGFSACQIFGKSFDQAAASLGWSVKTLDDKADPTTTITEIQQAVAAHADAIALEIGDCPNIKAGLLAAKAANIPVVGYGTLDCDYPGFGGGTPLFSAPMKLMGTTNGADLYTAYGRQDADMLAASLAAKGITSGKVIAIRTEDQVIQASLASGFAAELKVKCPRCTIAPITANLAQLTAGKGSQIMSSGLLANPGAVALYFPYDAILDLGLKTALASSHQNFKIILGGDGSGSGVALAASPPAGTQVIIHVYPNDYYGYALADTLNRVLHGDSVSSLPNQGGYTLYIDKTHHVTKPFDFQAAYQQVWLGS